MAKSVSVGVHEAKSRLSELLRRVEAGEQIEIRRGHQPLALIVPIAKSTRGSFGHDEGLFSIPEDFDAPLPDDVIADFEGGPS